MNFYHSLPIQIRFNDIDLARHVNNSIYLEYFDLGKLSYFRDVIGQSMDFEGISLVVASYRVDFYLPLRLEDQVEVRTRTGVLGNKSMEMIHHLCKTGESSPRAVSSTIMVCYDHSTGLSVPIPEVWKEKIRVFEHNECSDKSSG